MPLYPTPGLGISTSGLNKVDGWGSVNPATGQVFAGHAGDQGIDHKAGLSLAGLDVAGNPFITNPAESAITPTGATITWTTAASQPNGQVNYRILGAASYQIKIETGGPRTAHSVALTGLTAGKTYEYEVAQSNSATPPQWLQFSGRFTTPLTELLEGMSSPLDGTQAPVAEAPAPNGLELTNVSPAPSATAITVTWRTAVYADGQVDWEGGGGEGSVTEDGNKRMNHLVTVSGLQPDTAYSLVVTSQDASGAEGAVTLDVRTTVA